jgi:Cell division protein FtsI/penicillin-binding protein 2
MTARCVNGGYAVMPKLTRDAIDEGSDRTNAADFPAIGISARSRQILMHSLDEAMNHPRGTAYSSRISEPGRVAGGKTGTAQVRRITMMERESGVKKNKERPWRERDHSLFVGYAPVDKPKYAVSVVVEHSGGGSRTAAPIAHDVLKEVQRLYAPSQLAKRGVT